MTCWSAALSRKLPKADRRLRQPTCCKTHALPTCIRAQLPHTETQYTAPTRNPLPQPHAPTHARRVVLLPRRAVSAGEPLTLDYGANRSSLEFMADYGFVLTANRRDGDVPLPDAEKLPPLEVPRVEAAGRALLRAAAAAAEDAKWEREGGGGTEVVDADEVVLEDGRVVEVDKEGSGRGAEGGGEGGGYGRVNGVEVHPERVRCVAAWGGVTRVFDGADWAHGAPCDCYGTCGECCCSRTRLSACHLVMVLPVVSFRSGLHAVLAS